MSTVDATITFAAENIKAVVAIYQFLLLYSELTGLPSLGCQVAITINYTLPRNFQTFPQLTTPKLVVRVIRHARQYLKITLGNLLKPGVNGPCLCTLGSHPLV